MKMRALTFRFRGNNSFQFSGVSNMLTDLSLSNMSCNSEVTPLSKM